jgi:hypothetical protein
MFMEWNTIQVSKTNPEISPTRRRWFGGPLTSLPDNVNAETKNGPTLNGLMLWWNTMMMINYVFFCTLWNFREHFIQTSHKRGKREILMHCEIWSYRGSDNKTLKMDVACSSTTLVSICRATRRHIQEDSNLHFNSLKSLFYHEDRGNMFPRNVGTWRHIREDGNLHSYSLKSVFYHEDRGKMFLQNVGTYMATHPRRFLEESLLSWT